MIDGEGCVHRFRGEGAANRKSVDITNTEPELIAASAEALDLLGIQYRVNERRTPAGRPSWSIRLNSYESMDLLAKLVPIQHPRKRQILETIVTDYRGRLPFTPRVPKDVLVDRYVGNLRSARQIGLEFHSHYKTVDRWLRYYDIPVRTNLEATVLRNRRKAPP